MLRFIVTALTAASVLVDPALSARAPRASNPNGLKTLKGNCPQRFLDVQPALRTPADDCFVYPAVDDAGNWNAGTKPLGEDPNTWAPTVVNECGHPSGRQVYARNFTLDILGLRGEVIEEVIIFSYFFNMDQTTNKTRSHVGDWQFMGVWTYKEFNQSTVVRAICLSHNTLENPLDWRCYDHKAFKMFKVYESVVEDWRPMALYRNKDDDLSQEHVLVPINATWPDSGNNLGLTMSYDMPECISWDAMSADAQRTFNNDPWMPLERVPINDNNIEHYVMRMFWEARGGLRDYYTSDREIEKEEEALNNRHVHN